MSLAVSSSESVLVTDGEHVPHRARRDRELVPLASQQHRARSAQHEPLRRRPGEARAGERGVRRVGPPIVLEPAQEHRGGETAGLAQRPGERERRVRFETDLIERARVGGHEERTVHAGAPRHRLATHNDPQVPPPGAQGEHQRAVGERVGVQAQPPVRVQREALRLQVETPVALDLDPLPALVAVVEVVGRAVAARDVAHVDRQPSRERPAEGHGVLGAPRSRPTGRSRGAGDRGDTRWPR